MRRDPKLVFEKSIKCIKRTFDLDLTLIEKARLKELVDNSINELEALAEQCEKPLAYSFEYLYGKFNPAPESVSRFMTEYYGLPVEFANVHTSNPKEAGLYSHNKDAFNAYLKKLQEEMHHP